MILNETPVRTSRNFNANDIELRDFEVLEDVDKFLNRTIYVNSEKETLIVAESEEDTNRLNDLYEDGRVLISELTKDDSKLKYGVGEEIVNSCENNSNQPIRIVAKEGSAPSEVIVDFSFDEENANLQDIIEVYAEKNSNINVIINYVPKAEAKGLFYHNGIVKTCGLDDSKISITIVNLLNNSSTNFLSIENKLLDNASLDFNIVDFGGRHSITNYYSDLYGKCSNNNLNTIYLGNQNQLFDLNYIAQCRGEKTNVNIEVQGALKDNAIKHFKGTIDFVKGCKKAVGNENENCLLLSDTAKSLALPMLLCSEDDVEGNHSSSSGKADAKELFYLMTRGLSEKDAMKLLVRARFNKIIEGIANAETKDLILNVIDEKL